MSLDCLLEVHLLAANLRQNLLVHVLDMNKPQNLPILLCFRSAIPTRIGTMSGIQTESDLRSRGDVKESLSLFRRLDEGRDMWMKDQVQAKLIRHLCRLVDYLSYLLPLFCGQALAIVSGDPSRDSVSFLRLRVGQNQERRTQSRKQPTHLANLIHNNLCRGWIAQGHRDK